MSTKKRLEALTADLVLPPASPPPAAPGVGQGAELETRFPPATPGARAAARTAPGQMLAFRGQMLAAEGETARLKEQLKEFEGALPTRRLDPQLIHPTRWANRHEAAFRTAAYAGLKSDIEQAGGNVQPILVRPKADQPGHYEIVFGHRRHAACRELGIPVLAAIATEPLSDTEVFAAMDRENRERQDLSPYEQGLMYQRALDDQLYPSQRRLAEALGVSHTWVRKALAVAELPPAVIACFRSPLEIQHRHATRIAAALETDRRGVLRRADKSRDHALSPNAVVDHLLGDRGPSGSAPSSTTLTSLGRPIGRWMRDARGSLTIELNPGSVPNHLEQSLREQFLVLLDQIGQGD